MQFYVLSDNMMLFDFDNMMLFQHLSTHFETQKS